MKIAILGAGQLGRMLALAGIPLGLEFAFLDPSERPCAAALGKHVRADYIDAAAIESLTSGATVVTTEFENVPAEAMRLAGRSAPAFPTAQILSMTQDRVSEKALFQRLGIPTAAYMAINSRERLETLPASARVSSRPAAWATMAKANTGFGSLRTLPGPGRFWGRGH